MKKIAVLLVTVLLISAAVSGCTGSSAYMKKTEHVELLQPTSDMALVRFMRPSIYGLAINFNLLDGENVIGNSVAGCQFDYLTTPGKHLFIATSENKVFLEADLEAGKTYYIITEVYVGVWMGRVKFVAVTKGSKFWDKVLEYQDKLKTIKPDKEALLKWQEKHKMDIDKVIAAYNNVWKAKYDWPVLNPSDGR